MPRHYPDKPYSRSSEYRHKIKLACLDLHLLNSSESDRSSASEDSESYYDTSSECHDSSDDLIDEDQVGENDEGPSLQSDDEEDEIYFYAEEGYSSNDEEDEDENDDGSLHEERGDNGEEPEFTDDLFDEFEQIWHKDYAEFFECDEELDSEEENSNQEENQSDEPLYENARISVGQSIMMILQFYLRHKLSCSALADLLLLIYIHCPTPSKCLKSLYFFRKWLKNSDVGLKKHYYCGTCFLQMKHSTDKCTQCEKSVTTYFISIPVESQLNGLFSRPGFYNHLQYRFERVKKNDNNLEDIYDGEVYKGYCGDNNRVDLNLPTNISFTWNSDGVPIFKSSKFSIWPLFLKINELPPVERDKPCNMLMAGLWFGTHKPEADLFLEPLEESVNKICNGVKYFAKDLEATINVRGIVICGTCDLPAKAIFLNMVQYNGTFGCHKCLIKTQKLDNRRVYLKHDELHLRTLRECLRYASEACGRGRTVYGVKGPTILAAIVEDPIRSTVLDPMHLLSGISKTLLNVWFNSANKNLDASLFQHSKKVNEYLSEITPPSFVERTPRGLEDLSYWKASELIAWLLIYSLPILSTIMSNEYLNHHMMLVYGLYLLCQDSVSIDDIEKARQLFKSYISQFERLYTAQFMTCNIHSILHLCDIVRDYGPLGIFSCFPFENANGILKSLLHATRDAQLQICDTVSCYIQLDSLKSKYIGTDGVALDFCNRLQRKGTHRLKLSFVDDNIFVIGVPKKLTPVPRYLSQILERCGIVANSVCEFMRIMIDGSVYTSKSYTRAKKTNSTCVLFSENGTQNIGTIKMFVRVSNCSCEKGFCINCSHASRTLAIIKKYQSSLGFLNSNPEFTVSYVHRLDCDQTSPLVVIDVAHVLELYYHIKVDNQEYAVKPSTW